ncbi:MAG: PqqD family protein [Kiritimatiellia bacterium]|jgi:hypothetical protein
METSETSSPRRFCRTRNAVLRQVVGENLLVPIRSDGALDAEALYILDAVGAAVWEALASPVTLDEIAAVVRERFDVPEDQPLAADLQELLDDLLEQGLAAGG